MFRRRAKHFVIAAVLFMLCDRLPDAIGSPPLQDALEERVLGEWTEGTSLQLLGKAIRKQYLAHSLLATASQDIELLRDLVSRLDHIAESDFAALNSNGDNQDTLVFLINPDFPSKLVPTWREKVIILASKDNIRSRSKLLRVEFFYNDSVVAPTAVLLVRDKIEIHNLVLKGGTVMWTKVATKIGSPPLNPTEQAER